MTTLLYDADCSFCRTILGAMLARDREWRIRPVALQDALAADLLPGMSDEDRFASFHVVDENGTVLSGGKALPLVLGQLPSGALPARAMRALQPLTDAVYELISKHRSSIGPGIPEGWTARADAGIRRRQAELGGDAVAEAAEDDLAEVAPST